MKLSIGTMGSIFFTGLVMNRARAAETLRPDPAGYIRDWVMLAPIPLPEAESCADLVLKEQIKGEAALRPKAGDKTRIGGREMTWQTITASTNYFDFNAVLKTVNDHAAGFMVTYIECDREMPNLTVAVASNDQGRIYFNGVDIYAFTEARPLMLDADKGRVSLKAGVNVIVFKVVNEQNSWQGAMRFLDKDGNPVRDLKIKVAP